MSLAGDSGFISGALGTVRTCEISWVRKNDHPIIQRLLSIRWNGKLDVNEIHEGAIQIARYKPGDGYDWHMDLGRGAMSRRKLTLVLELAGAAEGGGLEVFAIGDLRLRPGDVAVFPSFIMHKALPVRAGERWSATVWLLGQEPLR